MSVFVSYQQQFFDGNEFQKRLKAMARIYQFYYFPSLGTRETLCEYPIKSLAFQLWFEQHDKMGPRYMDL